MIALALFHLNFDNDLTLTKVPYVLPGFKSSFNLILTIVVPTEFALIFKFPSSISIFSTISEKGAMENSSGVIEKVK